MTKFEKEYLKVTTNFIKVGIGKAISACSKYTSGYVQLHAYKERIIDCMMSAYVEKITGKENKVDWTDEDRTEIYQWERERLSEINNIVDELSKAFQEVSVENDEGEKQQ